MIERGLRRCAKYDRGAEVASELPEHAAGRGNQSRRKSLAFVKNNDAASDVVQLPAAAGSVAEQAFEKLHVGGDDDGGIPILGMAGGRVPRRFVHVFVARRLGQAVML